MRRFLVLAALALLPGCGSGDGAGDPASRPSSPAAAAAAPPDVITKPAPVPSAPAETTVLLDHLVAPRQEGRYPPRDDCSAVPGARAFREALATALLKGAGDTLAAMAVPQVKLGFGGQDGRDRLRERLKDPAYRLHWRKVLELGCAIDAQGQMVMPWHFAQELGVEDPFSAMVVLGRDVPLREGASPAARTRTMLAWDLVDLVGALRPGQAFQRVRTASGEEGYVATAALRSLVDYRLIAVNRAGVWEVTAMVAGD